jgi:hypothetical protein
MLKPFSLDGIVAIRQMLYGLDNADTRTLKRYSLDALVVRMLIRYSCGGSLEGAPRSPRCVIDNAPVCRWRNPRYKYENIADQ